MRKIIILLICGIEKNGTCELICKAETPMQRTNMWIPKGEAGNELEDWD